MNKLTVISVVLICMAAAGPIWGQVFEDVNKEEVEWQGFLVSGWFSGETLLSTSNGINDIQVKTDDGWLIGVRAGGENEYLGAEVTVAGVFADMHVKSDLFTDPPSGSDARTFLLGINGLLYPTGNEILEGRIRPFMTVGPGVALIDTDYSKVSNETVFDMNVGLGVKFLLGDSGNTMLRADWRWYYLVGSMSGLDNKLYHQELSIGLGIRF